MTIKLSRRNALLGGAASVFAASGAVSFASAQGLPMAPGGLRPAFLYGFGPYEFARSIQVMSGQVESDGAFSASKMAAGRNVTLPYLNQHVHITTLADPSLREVTTPNNDTLYTSAVLELSQGPVEVRAPESKRRYMSIAFMDAFTDQFHFIGTRATNGEGGRFWILGPEDRTAPPSGVRVVRAPTNDVWMLARTFVAGEEDLAAARRHQAKISAAPVYPERAPRSFATKATASDDPENFITLVNELLGRSPIAGQAKRAKNFRRWGVRPGDLEAWDDMLRPLKRVWGLVVDRGGEKIAEEAQAKQSGAGWIIPPSNLGDYGDDDQTRAGVALIGFGALTIEEAMYFRASTDSVTGAPLDGSRRYQIRIPPEGLPVDAFWSLSMYAPDASGRYFFYENEIDRYAINSSSQDLVRRSDGSIVLALQPDRPSDPDVVWMPTPKGGEFASFMRTYLPSKELQTGRASLPPIEPV